MKTFRLWRLVAVGVVLSLFAAEVRADDKKLCDEKCQRERAAKAALALAAAKADRPGFVNLAPVPRAIPEPMPKAKCACGEACKCPDGKCPAGCAKPEPKKAEPAADLEWNPYWDGRQWQPRWTPKQPKGVSRTAAPFPASTPTTGATGAARVSTSWPASTPTVRTLTPARAAAIPGVTNCAPGVG